MSIVDQFLILFWPCIYCSTKEIYTYASHILSEGGGGILIVTRETKPLKSMPNVMVVLIFSMAFCTKDNSVADWKKFEVAIRSTNLNIRLALPGFVVLKKTKTKKEI